MTISLTFNEKNPLTSMQITEKFQLKLFGEQKDCCAVAELSNIKHQKGKPYRVAKGDYLSKRENTYCVSTVYNFSINLPVFIQNAVL